MTKEKNRIPFCRIVLLSLSFFLFTASVAADFDMWVGQTGEYEMYGAGYYNFRVTRVSCTNPSVTCNLVGWLAKWEIAQYFPGTATIIIEYAYQASRGESYKNDKKTLTVSCIDNPVTVSPSSLSLKTGEYYDLSYQFQNLRYVSRPSLQWSTDDRSGKIITVSSGGRVTAKGPGTATVYLDHSEGSNRGTCVVTVTEDGSTEPITPVQPDPPVQPQNNKLIVTASPWGGEVEKDTEVYLTAMTSDGTEVPNAWIHYTLDGSTPRTWDVEFSRSSPIVIKEDCTVKAFAEVIRKSNPKRYEFSVHETKTHEVLEDVRSLKSEVGVISFSDANESVIRKLCKDYQLDFTPLMKRETYVYVWEDHPLADRTEISIEELKDFACVSILHGVLGSGCGRCVVA